MRWQTWFAVGFLALLGLAVRLSDLHDPPLDFHPTRQLRGLLIARYLYFQWEPSAGNAKVRQATEHAVQRMGAYEPPLLETFMALSYRLLGREIWWLGRVYASLLWMLGALALFGLARQTAPNAPLAALVPLGVLAIHPFVVRATRTVQPDPLMTAALTGGVWLLYRWLRAPTRQHGLGSALLLGLAAWVKIFALPAVGLLLVTAVFVRWGQRAWRRPQAWVMLILGLAPALLFYGFVRQASAGSYWQTWVWDLRGLWFSKRLYARWLGLLVEIYGGGWLFAASISWLLLPRMARLLALAWGAGYVIYGFLVPYQMMTHAYYHLLLLPLWAWALTPGAGRIVESLPKALQWRIWTVLAALVAVLYTSGSVYKHFRDNDYRREPARWQQVAQAMPPGPCIGLVEFYGYGMAYYGGRDVIPWPSDADRSLARLRGQNADVDRAFRQRVEGFHCFVVTDWRGWDRRPELRAALTQVPLLFEGEAGLVFDLRPRSQAPSP